MWMGRRCLPGGKIPAGRRFSYRNIWWWLEAAQNPRYFRELSPHYALEMNVARAALALMDLAENSCWASYDMEAFAPRGLVT